MTKGAARPAPIAVYVHWPYCARICPYCDFNVVRDRAQAEQADLVVAILADLRAQAALTGPRALSSIFFGGGTPSLMRPDWAAAIIAEARALWPADGEPEISLEANPTDAEAGRFAALADAGVSRLSLGLQSTDDAALKFLGRNHDAAEALRAARLAGRLFARLSIDLIYARPGQTVAGWAQELRGAVDLGAEHISPYQLTIEPGTAFDRAVGRGALIPPDPDLAASLYETTQDVLAAAGFDAYEVSNHARGPAARSRHNLAYWTGQDYVGVGPGAHGRLTLDGDRVATEAARRVGDYITQVRATGLGFPKPEVLAARDVALERLLMGLRIDQGVPWTALAPLGLSAGSAAVEDLAAQGLVVAGSTHLAATRAGRTVLDGIIRGLA